MGMKTILFAVAALLFGGWTYAAEMTVSGAASLTNAFTELAGIFEKKHPGLSVNTNYAASNPLLKQIVEGAPVDVFASADQATMDKAGEAKVVDPATRKNFAANDLVLIVPKNSKCPLICGILKNSDALPSAITIPCPPVVIRATP